MLTFSFSRVASTASMIAYAVVIAIFAVAVFGIRAWIAISSRRNKKMDMLRDDSEHDDSIPLGGNK